MACFNTDFSKVICFTINDLSGILDTTDTSFLQPWAELCQAPLKLELELGYT